ncbi:MAG: class I SAM-dependent methyltransferase [Rhodanobacteraceae bacterium]
MARVHGFARSAATAILRPRLPATLDPRTHQPPLPLPDGYSKERILDALCSVSIDGSKTGELHGYASADCERFLHTLNLVPEGAGELLEIGGNPYFTSLLLRRFRPGYRLNMTNFFSGPPGVATQRVRFDGFDGSPDECDFTYNSLNIEAWQFPFADAQMDVVVFGEVLEHMTNDPMHAMREISRVLKPDGLLVLTTPNVARIENVLALAEGRNVADHYSAYGPYGRHNREYTRHELHQLLDYSGFDAEVSYTANVHGDIPAHTVDLRAIEQALLSISNREHDLGQYLFTRSRRARACGAKRPNWLYRSYPDEQLAG